MKPSHGSVGLIIFQNFASKRLGYIVQGSRTEDNIEFMIEPKIEHVCLKKIHFNAHLICESFCLIQSQSHRIKRRDVIAISRKKYCVFPFATSYIKQAQGLIRRTKFHHLIAHSGRLVSPIIPGRFVSLLIVHNFLLLRRISEKRIDIAVKNICKKRQNGKIRG